MWEVKEEKTMSDEFRKTLDKALTLACLDLTDSKLAIERIHSGNKGKAVSEFIELVFEWRKDEDKAQLLYTIFGQHAFCTDRLLFLGSFESFLSNLHDDTYYEIRWERTKFSKNFDVVWDANGSPARESTKQDDPRARPVVYTSGEGSQDFQGLIDLMNLAWERQEQRRIEFEREMNED